MTKAQILQLEEVLKQHPILLFDGVCNLCNGAVQFIIKRDPQAKIRFASLQSDTGKYFLRKLNMSESDFDTAVLVTNKNYYTESAMGLHTAKHLSGIWPVLYSLIILPAPYPKRSVSLYFQKPLSVVWEARELYSYLRQN